MIFKLSRLPILFAIVLLSSQHVTAMNEDLNLPGQATVSTENQREAAPNEGLCRKALSFLPQLHSLRPSNPRMFALLSATLAAGAAALALKWWSKEECDHFWTCEMEIPYTGADEFRMIRECAKAIGALIDPFPTKRGIVRVITKTFCYFHSDTAAFAKCIGQEERSMCLNLEVERDPFSILAFDE